jgi:hypothetical protein
MARLEIWVHDHRDHDHQTRGPVIRVWPNSPNDYPGQDYAGWRAHYGTWLNYRAFGNPPDMIGFFAYRYYLWDPSWFPLSTRRVKDNAPNWLGTSRGEFEAYRSFWSTWDGAEIKQQLEHCDILQSAPCYLSAADYGADVISDFGASGSANDTAALLDVVQKHGFYRFNGNRIYHWLFITHWPVFNRMMWEMEPLRLELHERCNGLDSTNEAYKKRVMDYVMERVYPLWLLKSGFKFKEIAQLQCEPN